MKLAHFSRGAGPGKIIGVRKCTGVYGLLGPDGTEEKEVNVVKLQ